MRLILMAWRNLNRNRQRTLITALSIAIGVLASVVLQGLSSAFVRSLIEAKVESRVGALQVFRSGYFDSEEPLRLSLAWNHDITSRILRVPGVTSVAPRIEFDGLLSNGTEATMFQGSAIDPALEYKVCPKRRRQVGPDSMPLRSERIDEMLVGRTIAESLGVDKGATLVMQAAGPHASTNALDVEVSGFLPVIDFSESKRVALVSLQFAQDLLRMPGRVTSYAVGIEELDHANVVAQRLRHALGKDYLVLTWEDLDPGTRTRALTAEYAFFLVTVMLFLLAASGIINTMLMSVSERVREIGTMLSLGVRRWQITVLFLSEAALSGVLSALGGAALGYGVVSALGAYGVLGPMAGGDKMILYPRVGFGSLLATVLFAVSGAVLAGLYPAWKAARLRPVEALRAN